MKSREFFFVAAMAAALALAPVGAYGQVPGMTLDQADTPSGTQFVFSNYRTLWQSYTAGTNGHLGAMDVVIYSTDGADWNATFAIYEGEGMAGRTLASQTVSGGGGVIYRTFLLDVPVRQTSGSQYTFAFANASTGLSVRLYANSYAGGRCSQNSGYDYRFHTYVITSDWSEEVYRDTNFTASATVISNAAQLAQFAYLVNGGARYIDKTVTLADDISLAGHFWTPISTNGNFSGTFEGSNRTIRCVVIDRPTRDTQGLFGFAGGHIQNVNVADVDITGRDYVGGLIADGIGGYLNCNVSGKVTGHFYVGGVLGYGHGTTEGCTNRCSVDGYSVVGGVVGLGGNSELLRCRNEGAVSGYSRYVGGVMGQAQGNILDCSNAGPVSCTTGEYGGGVVGQSSFDVFNCRNSGNVSGSVSAGGIVGAANGGALTRCVNSGSVSGNTAVGGIVGFIDNGGMQNCANSGAVDGAVGAGGLAGGQESFAFNSVNSGAVTGGRGVGGVMGISEFGGECHNCQNSGAVSGSQYVGALAGIGGVLTNCYWKQTGVAPFDLEPAGDGTVTLQECRPFGAAPGTLAAPVTLLSATDEPVTTSSLSGALNAYVVRNAYLNMGLLRRWTAGSATAYPALADTRWSDPGNFDTNWYHAAASQFAIGTAEELAGLAVLVNGGQLFANKTVTLTADISLTDREWTPIGHTFSGAGNYFYGTLEGNGKTITGAWQDAYDMDRYEMAGLFGVVPPGAVVRNLAIVDAQSVAAMVGGGIAGYQAGTLQNCSCSASVFARQVGGCLVGYADTEGIIENCYCNGFSFADWAAGALAGGNKGTISNCYWRFTGTDPLDQPAIGDGYSGQQCSSFAEAPGTLASNVTAGGVMTNNLSAALNAWVEAKGSFQTGFYNWTAGTSERYPRLTPLIVVGRDLVPQALSEGFAVGVTLTEATNTVAVYSADHLGTTAMSFGSLLCDADAMGFTFADLVAGQAILDFSPGLSIVGFDLATRTLTFSASNGIDTTATAAMNRLEASTAAGWHVLQTDTPGGSENPLVPTVAFHGDGTADVVFTPAGSPTNAFFRLRLEHRP